MTRDGYTPGWGDDALKMMRSRDATTRAGFVLPFLRNGMRVLDVGCGPGTITRGLADAVAPDGLAVGVDLHRDGADVLGSAYALPVRPGSVDVVFAHALAEHLGDLALALAEMYRVLRPDGLLAIASSDWSGAAPHPRTADVESALQAHYLLRYDAGGDPFAGGHLPAAVRRAGFTDVLARDTDWADMTYRDLAHYLATRLDSLPAAQAAAMRWAERDGTFTQRWVRVTARR